MTIETKYNIGDEVWFPLNDETPVKAEVVDISCKVRSDDDTILVEVEYWLNYTSPRSNQDEGIHWDEGELYPNLNAYIEALQSHQQKRIEGIKQAAEYRYK